MKLKCNRHRTEQEQNQELAAAVAVPDLEMMLAQMSAVDCVLNSGVTSLEDAYRKK